MSAFRTYLDFDLTPERSSGNWFNACLRSIALSLPPRLGVVIDTVDWFTCRSILFQFCSIRFERRNMLTGFGTASFLLNVPGRAELWTDGLVT